MGGVSGSEPLRGEPFANDIDLLSLRVKDSVAGGLVTAGALKRASILATVFGEIAFRST